MNITEKKLDELFFNSHEDVRNFIISGKLEQVFIDIENKYYLTENESRILQEESLSYLLGAIESDECVATIIITIRSRENEDMSNIIKDIESSIINQKKHLS